jgi:hypothetical protein
MKLQAGNPNLIRQAARVNPHATLESFTNTTGNKAHAKERTGFVPTIKDPNAVPPPAINVWQLDTYVPEAHIPARRGADDHFKYKSKGV